MTALQILDTKEFMHHLLIAGTFDNFSLVEADITTAFNTKIDGHLNSGFYSNEDELEALNLNNSTYMPWSAIKPFCYSIIKGKNTPLSFRITLSLSNNSICNVLNSGNFNLKPEDVKALLANFKFNGKNIICTTATNLTVFTTDKSLDNEWDSLMLKFLKKHIIVSTQL